MNSRRTSILIIMAVAAIVVMMPVTAQRRRMTPVDNPSTVTQSVNETKNDTAHINAARRARSVHYHDDNGNVVYLDTVTGEEWRDSTAIMALPKMKYPLIFEGAVGINIWDPVMRAFGQHYGLVEFSAELNLHNRYIPVVEIGLGQTDYTSEENNYTYRVPVTPYFRIGCNYNFLYNSNPDYLVMAGVRFGFTRFSYDVNDVTINSDYWGESAVIDFPRQNCSFSYMQLVFGLRVKVFGPVSMGWYFRYKAKLHESKDNYGKPWYIPGFGSRKGAITGSFYVAYTIPLHKKEVEPIVE